MKLCISYWSIEGGLANTRPIDEAMKEAKDAGFDGIELNYDLDNDLSPKSGTKEYENIRKMADKIGLQISGAHFGELNVLALAHAYEQATEWHTRNPKL